MDLCSCSYHYLHHETKAYIDYIVVVVAAAVVVAVAAAAAADIDIDFAHT